MVDMTQTVTIREVNQHTSAVFARVSQGEALIVTKDGRPQAKITPYRGRDTFEQMVADGLIVPAVSSGAATIQPLQGGSEIDRILADERADRSWL